MTDTIHLCVVINDEIEEESRHLRPGEEPITGDERPLPSLTREARDPLNDGSDARPGGHWWLNTITHTMWWSHGDNTWSRIGEYAPPTEALYEAAPEFADTFVKAPGAIGSPWALVTDGGNVAVVAPPANTTGRNLVVGVLRMSTGPKKEKSVGFTLAPDLIRLEGGLFSLWVRIMVPTVDPAHPLNFHIGFVDAVLTDPVDGVYFEYHPQVSPNWGIKTANNSTFASADSGVPVVAGEWVDLRINVDATIPAATFVIDDVEVGTIQLNIPTAVGQETSIGASLVNGPIDGENLVYLDRIFLKREAAQGGLF